MRLVEKNYDPFEILIFLLPDFDHGCGTTSTTQEQQTPDRERKIGFHQSVGTLFLFTPTFPGSRRISHRIRTLIPVCRKA